MKTDTQCLKPTPRPKKEKNSPDIFLSVIISAFDERDRIDDTLGIVKNYLQSRDFSSEIIIADESSYDSTTEIIKSLDGYVYEFKEQRSTRVKRKIEHLGQGFSMARSVLRTRGKYILWTDEDLSTPISEVEKMWPHLNNGVDVVIAFPKIQLAQRSCVRWGNLMEWAIKPLVQLINVAGGQYRPCSFKLFEQKSARRIAKAQKLYGRGFDIEQLYLAQTMGFTIKEIPVEWRPVDESKARSLNDSIHLLFDIIRILYVHRGLRRYKKNQTGLFNNGLEL